MIFLSDKFSILNSDDLQSCTQRVRKEMVGGFLLRLQPYFPTSLHLLLYPNCSEAHKISKFYNSLPYSSRVGVAKPFTVSETVENKNSFVKFNGEEISGESYNLLIRDCCREGDMDKAMAILAQMEALGFHPSVISYAHLVEGLGDVGRTLEAEAVFQEMVFWGVKPGVTMCNAMLRGCLKKGLLELAGKLLILMDGLGISRNQETYEILVDYYVKAGRLEDTWCVINQMKQRGFQLNSFVYSKIICLYRDNGMWKKAMEIVQEIRERGMTMDARIYSSIIDTFGKYGELREALEVFDRMQQEGIKPDITTWNSLIRWHCKVGDFTKTIDLFTMMLEQGFHPDPKVFINLISRLGEKGKWDMIKKIFEIMKFRGHEKSGAFYAVLVDIYGQYGRFQDAEECVLALKAKGFVPSASFFCVLANAYAQQVRCL